MDLWEKHALRLRRQVEIERRQAKFERINAWLLEHPRQAFSLSIGAAVLILELSEFLRLALDALAAWMAS